MGSGIVLTYLLVVAIAFPVVWVGWWTVASLGDPRRRAVPAPAAARPAAAPVPHATDGGLSGRPGEVVIRRLKDGLEVGSCHGPDSGGRCPRMTAGGTVPCAGAVIALPRAVRGSLEWHIPSGYRTCMLGGYDAFRQASSTG